MWYCTYTEAPALVSELQWDSVTAEGELMGGERWTGIKSRARMVNRKRSRLLEFGFDTVPTWFRVQ